MGIKWRDVSDKVSIGEVRSIALLVECIGETGAGRTYRITITSSPEYNISILREVILDSIRDAKYKSVEFLQDVLNDRYARLRELFEELTIDTIL